MPLNSLLAQLGQAGMDFADGEQIISSTEKVKLLGFLRRTHGKQRDGVSVKSMHPETGRAKNQAPILVQLEKPKSEVVEQRKGVFVVHGHDGELKEKVARYLERIGLDPVVLHERPNQGRSLMEKFRDHASKVSFAVVLMTPDDVGGPAGSPAIEPRARQNVILELGFFLGKFESRNVCALVKGHVTQPSDFHGVTYIPADDDTWKMALAKELREAGVPFDLAKILYA